MFKKPFSFNGRIRRLEYGISLIIYIIYANVIQYIVFTETDYPENESVLILILLLPSLWFMIAQNAKRCHDRGNTGWFQIIPFYCFWMLFADSEYGENKFGPNPKGIGNLDEIDEIGSHLN